MTKTVPSGTAECNRTNWYGFFLEGLVLDPGKSTDGQNRIATAAIVVLLVLTGVMLLALFSRTTPHPPLDVPPFALGPFLGASLAIGSAAFYLVRLDAPFGKGLAILFALTALVSFGPQKYFDPAFSRIWPAVITAQVAIGLVVICCAATLGRRRRSS